MAGDAPLGRSVSKAWVENGEMRVRESNCQQERLDRDEGN